MRAIVLLFLSVFFFASCNCDDDAGMNEITLDLIAQGTLSGSEGVNPQTSVFDNQTDWDGFLEDMESQLSFFTTTTVDFGSKQVIAVVGEIQTSGSGLSITSVEEAANNIVVTYTVELNAATVISQPYHVVSMPKSNKSVIFVQED